MAITLSKAAARRFMLLHQGLLGERRFVGKEGALDYVRQCGCIQFDPVDVCGRNAELTLQSRVCRFTKKTLYDLLYKDRLLFDYLDKELSILPIESWPYFRRYREHCRLHEEQFPDMAALREEALGYIKEHGPVDSSSLPIEGKTQWFSAIHWSGNWHGETNAARSVLEQLYTAGELAIHHKTGTRKSYDLAERCIPAEYLSAQDPLPDAQEHLKWRVYKRVGAVGLLWNRNSPAFLGLSGFASFGAEERREAFAQLLSEGLIAEAHVEGIGSPLYLRTEDLPLAEIAASDAKFRPRCEFLAPLDPFLWDKPLISRIFDFSYTWEIYTPAEKRKYGYYVLPVVCGERFIGRIEAIPDRKTGVLTVKNIWLEDGVRAGVRLSSAIRAAAKRFARFNGCTELVMPDSFRPED